MCQARTIGAMKGDFEYYGPRYKGAGGIDPRVYSAAIIVCAIAWMVKKIIGAF